MVYYVTGFLSDLDVYRIAVGKDVFIYVDLVVVIVAHSYYCVAGQDVQDVVVTVHRISIYSYVNKDVDFDSLVRGLHMRNLLVEIKLSIGLEEKHDKITFLKGI